MAGGTEGAAEGFEEIVSPLALVFVWEGELPADTLDLMTPCEKSKKYKFFFNASLSRRRAIYQHETRKPLSSASEWSFRVILPISKLKLRDATDYHEGMSGVHRRDGNDGLLQVTGAH